MSDFPFSIPRRGGDGDVVNGVSYAGTTLTLTRAEGSDLTTTIPTTRPFGFINYGIFTKEYTVKHGNPDDSDPDDLDGVVNEMDVSIVLPNDNTNVMLTCRMMGEWAQPPHDKGLAIKKKRVPLGGGTPVISILRPPQDGNSGRILSTWTLPIDIQDTNSTIESATIIFMDTVDSGTITYTPLLVNTSSSVDSLFKLNRTISNANGTNYERTTSTLIAQAMN
jgi:hypothetical protein